MLVSSRTGIWTSCEAPSTPILTRTTAPGSAPLRARKTGLSSVWRSRWLPAFNRMIADVPGSLFRVTVMSQPVVLVIAPRTRPGSAAPRERIKRSSSFAGPTVMLTPLEAGVIRVVSCGLVYSQALHLEVPSRLRRPSTSRHHGTRGPSPVLLWSSSMARAPALGLPEPAGTASAQATERCRSGRTDAA